MKIFQKLKIFPVSHLVTDTAGAVGRFDFPHAPARTRHVCSTFSESSFSETDARAHRAHELAPGPRPC